MTQFLLGAGCLMLAMFIVCVMAMMEISKKPTPGVK